MAHSHSSNPSHDAAGNDGMNLRKIIGVGVAALTVFAVGIVWSYYLLHAERDRIEANGKADPATEIGKAEIGIVDQVLFSTDDRLTVFKAEHAKKLNGFGWVDRAKGLAHIPIDQAIQKVIASPPDIAGEGVPPAASAPVLPPAARVEDGSDAPGGKASGKGSHKAERTGDKAGNQRGGKP